MICVCVTCCQILQSSSNKISFYFLREIEINLFIQKVLQLAEDNLTWLSFLWICELKTSNYLDILVMTLQRLLDDKKTKHQPLLCIFGSSAGPVFQSL